MVSPRIFYLLCLKSFTYTINVDIGLPMAQNAAALVAEYRVKLRSIFDLWIDTREGINIPLQQIRAVYGPESYAYNQ